MENVKVTLIGKPIITNAGLDLFLSKRLKSIFDYFDNEDNLKQYEDWLNANLKQRIKEIEE